MALTFLWPTESLSSASPSPEETERGHSLFVVWVRKLRPRIRGLFLVQQKVFHMGMWSAWTLLSSRVRAEETTTVQASEPRLLPPAECILPKGVCKLSWLDGLQ